MDKKTEGYFHLQTLQSIVVTLSQSALSGDELESISKIMDSIKYLIDLWQCNLFLNGDAVRSNSGTQRRILGHLTLIFSHLQIIERNSCLRDDVNWQYFHEILTELNQIILEFDAPIEI